MVSITLSVSEKIRELMKQFPEVNWSGFIRQCIESKAEKLAWKEKMLKQLESERDFDAIALELGREVKQKAWEKLKKEGW